MTTSTEHTLWGPVQIRLAVAADRPALERLAELDCAPSLRGPVLLAELRGQAVAALGLGAGEITADPFVPTADLVELLRLRARQLSPAVTPRVDGHRRRYWSRLIERLAGGEAPKLTRGRGPSSLGARLDDFDHQFLFRQAPGKP